MTGFAADVRLNGGYAYVFDRVDGEWVESAFLGELVGSQVYGSSLALDGDTIAVGVPTGWLVPGEVWLYRLGSRGWALEAILTDGGGADHYGESLGLAGDTLVVGAYNSNEMSLGGDVCHFGIVFVYERSAAGWSERARPRPTDHECGDDIGRRVAFEGDRLVFSSRYTDPRLHVFDRQHGSWVERFTLQESETESGSFLGDELGLAGDQVVAGTADWDVEDPDRAILVFDLSEVSSDD